MNQTAGKVIASGSYGCVIRPSLECTDTPSDNSKVSKVIERENLEDEYSNILGFNLHKLDPDKLLFVYPDEPLCNLIDIDIPRDGVHKCENIANNVGRVTDINKQQKIETINSKLAIINFPYGGVDLVDYKLTGSVENKRTQTKVLMASMLNIFYGVQVLSTNNIVHRDIKPGNIVFDGVTSKLIDFGLSMNYRTDRNSFTKFTTYEYIYWPLEYNIMHPVATKDIYSDPSYEKPIVVMELLKKITELQDNRGRRPFNINKVVDESSEKLDLTNLIIKYKLNKKISDEDYYTQFYEKFDVYSVGVVLYHIFLLSNQRIHIDSDIIAAAKILIQKMTKSPYTKRISLKDAAIEYRTILLNSGVISGDDVGLMERRFNQYFSQ